MTNFVVLRQDVSYLFLASDVIGPIANLMSINETHIDATESMFEFIDKDKKKFDEIVIIDKNRVEITDRSPGWVTRARNLRLVYTIQEFINDYS